MKERFLAQLEMTVANDREQRTAPEMTGSENFLNPT